MEEGNLETMDLKPLRKLNFNAPLLSTKRLSYSGIAGPSCLSNSSDLVQNTRVPFSWEQAPGKPKDIERSNSVHDGDTPRPRLPPCLWQPLDGDTPRPRLPPCLWRPPKEAAEADVSNGIPAFDRDDGCDGDDDNDNDDDDDKKNDVFSDALDVLSLSEALDIVQQSETAAHSDNNVGLRLKLEECNGDQSPTYMINRFLHDANALAASSVLHLSNEVCDTWSHEACLKGSIRHSCDSSSKGCGLGSFFSWRMKHKFCAIKSPILPCSPNVQKHQHSSKPKKHCSCQHSVTRLADN